MPAEYLQVRRLRRQLGNEPDDASAAFVHRLHVGAGAKCGAGVGRECGHVLNHDAVTDVVPCHHGPDARDAPLRTDGAVGHCGVVDAAGQVDAVDGNGRVVRANGDGATEVGIAETGQVSAPV